MLYASRTGGVVVVPCELQGVMNQLPVKDDHVPPQPAIRQDLELGELLVQRRIVGKLRVVTLLEVDKSRGAAKPRL